MPASVLEVAWVSLAIDPSIDLYRDTESFFPRKTQLPTWVDAIVSIIGGSTNIKKSIRIDDRWCSEQNNMVLFLQLLLILERRVWYVHYYLAKFASCTLPLPYCVYTALAEPKPIWFRGKQTMHVLSTTTEKRRNIRLLEATIALPLSPCCNRLNPKYGRTDRHHQPSKFSFFIALSYFAIIRFALPLPHYHSVCLSVCLSGLSWKKGGVSQPSSLERWFACVSASTVRDMQFFIGDGKGDRKKHVYSNSFFGKRSDGSRWYDLYVKCHFLCTARSTPYLSSNKHQTGVEDQVYTISTKIKYIKIYNNQMIYEVDS